MKTKKEKIILFHEKFRKFLVNNLKEDVQKELSNYNIYMFNLSEDIRMIGEKLK